MRPDINIFVCGLAGTSRGGTITHVIDQIHPAAKASLDRCYVNNFKSPDRPRLLALPRGQANNFKKDVQSGIEFLRRRIPQVFEGEPFQRQKGPHRGPLHGSRKGIDGRFHAAHCARAICAGPHAGRARSRCRKFSRSSKGRWCRSKTSRRWCTKGKLETIVAEDLERKYEQFRQEFTVVYRKTLTLSRELASELSYLEQEAASVLVDGFIEELKEKYSGDSGDRVSGRSAPQHSRQPRSVQGARGRRGARRAAASGKRFAFRVRPSAILSACTASTSFSRTTMKTDRRSFLKPRRRTPILFGTIQRSYDSRGGWNSDFMDLRAGSTLARRWRISGDVRAGRADRSRGVAHAQAHAESRDDWKFSRSKCFFRSGLRR